MSEAGWFSDPMSRHQYRWWDGELWTEQVSSNGHQGADPMPFAPPPALPVIADHDGPAFTDPLFTAALLVYEEKGSMVPVGQGGRFGNFTITSPQYGPVGTVERSGKANHRFYHLRTAAGTPLCTLNPLRQRVWTMVHANGQPLGEFTFNPRLGKDMLVPISVGGYQVAEITSTDLRGTKLTMHGLTGILGTIERPKGVFADSFSTLDNYTMTRHQPAEGSIGWLSVMAPVVIDDARYRRDVARGPI